MTSDVSKYISHNNLYLKNNLSEIARIYIENFESSTGFKVSRLKLECQPLKSIEQWVLYYEVHIKFELKSKDDIMFNEWCKHYTMHRSVNANKLLNDGKILQFATYRTRIIDHDAFMQHVEKLVFIAKLSGLQIVKVETEACIIDTNESLDAEWLRNCS